MASTMTERLMSDSGRMNTAHSNLVPAALVEAALARGEGRLAANGALVATTGPRTGRSPRDRFVVQNAETEASVDWGAVNRPMEQQVYDALRERVLAYAQQHEVFDLDATAGADPATALPVTVVTEYAWHNLFARQILRPAAAEAHATRNAPFTVYSIPGFHPIPQRDGTSSDAVIALDLARREVLIAGTEYAGEIKKSIFSVMNFLLPAQGVLPMHCSANVGALGDVALFFGLSGTGKTSLSSDPERRLIGDDEHGWGDDGVFNFEGGCYAKCIRLRRADEPQIYDAIRFGAVIENVVIDPRTREPDYDDASLTENTRVAYPLDFIENVVPSGMGGHAQSIFFLTADAFGVLPPISRLSPEQAMYHFLSGYTAKLAGTEVGLGRDPEAAFEACFGSPFLPLPALTYARMLRDKLMQHGTRVFLLNTGWSGGPAGRGSRIRIGYTRAMVRAALAGELDQVTTYVDARFGLHVPLLITGVPEALMQPRATWSDGDAYDHAARALAERFVENFKKFGPAAEELAAFGPSLAT
jgi:phosphoenolpyruvate carboxykinase (ATP)